MKHCQSALVSCKVEWFCSLPVFSRWPGLSYFPLSLRLSLPLSSVLVPFLKKQRKSSTGPGGEGRVIRPITVKEERSRYLQHAFWLQETNGGFRPLAGLAALAVTCCCLQNCVCVQILSSTPIPAELFPEM